MLFGICLHTSCKPKFWHKYMITYFNFIIVKPWLGPYFKIRWWQYWNDGNKRMVWFTQGLFFKKYHIWLYLLILIKKECISFHFSLIPSPTFKGTMKLYILHALFGHHFIQYGFIQAFVFYWFIWEPSLHHVKLDSM